jgi:hypothetical protein
LSYGGRPRGEDRVGPCPGGRLLSWPRGRAPSVRDGRWTNRRRPRGVASIHVSECFALIKQAQRNAPLIENQARQSPTLTENLLGSIWDGSAIREEQRLGAGSVFRSRMSDGRGWNSCSGTRV